MPPGVVVVVGKLNCSTIHKLHHRWPCLARLRPSLSADRQAPTPLWCCYDTMAPPCCRGLFTTVIAGTGFMMDAYVALYGHNRRCTAHARCKCGCVVCRVPHSVIRRRYDLFVINTVVLILKVR